MPLNMIRPLGNGKFQTPTGVFDSYAEAIRSVSPQMSPAQAQPSFGNRMATMADPFNNQRQEAALKSSPAQPMSPEYIMSQKQGGLLDAPSAPQQERSFMDKLSSQEGLGSLGALMLSMSNNPNLQKLGMAELGDIQKRGSTNKTIKALRDAKREDLANAVESGMLGASDAAKILFAEKKKQEPYKLGAGETLIDPVTLKPIATGAPKDETPAAFKALQLRAEAAGLKEGTQEYADFMVRAGAQSGMELTVGKDGQVRFSTGGVGSKALTEGQSNAVGFYNRMANAQTAINDLEKEGTDMYGYLVNQVPLTNAFQSPSFQRYQRAKLDFITAVLRKESGATIGDTEFAKEDQKYFPQVGDSPQVIEDKRKAREIAVESMKTSAGSGVQSSSSGGIKVVGVKSAG